MHNELLHIDLFSNPKSLTVCMSKAVFPDSKGGNPAPLMTREFYPGSSLVLFPFHTIILLSSSEIGSDRIIDGIGGPRKETKL